MSLGGFTAIVEITRARVSGGFGDGGQVFNHAQMELEGKLSELFYGDFRGHIADHITASVDLVIDFTETQERSQELEDTDQAYIGHIRLTVAEKEIHAVVSITLPIAVFQQLSIFGDKKFLIDTIHDIIANPSECEKDKHIVAYVKRVYFKGK
jgi:hypothetical protein